MMLKPSISQIMKEGQSYYSLVVAVAKLAREIAEDAERNHEVLVEKPVKLSVDEFANGNYYFVESKNIGKREER